MSKKRKEVQEEGIVNDTPQEDFAPNSDFNLEDEYKPEPLVPGGNYRGNVTGVVLDVEHNSIVWRVVLDENGGVMSDGETPIDGSVHFYRNWLPKPGDENEPSSSGKNSKRQSKINMLKRFADNMKINMNSRNIIMEAITEQEWVGLPVIVTVSATEYMGIIHNQIDKMVAASE